jgi:hypothetical protein
MSRITIDQRHLRARLTAALSARIAIAEPCRQLQASRASTYDDKTMHQNSPY